MERGVKSKKKRKRKRKTQEEKESIKTYLAVITLRVSRMVLLLQYIPFPHQPFASSCLLSSDLKPETISLTLEQPFFWY